VTATETTAAVLTAEDKYKTYAAVETAEGYEAWNADDYHRATKLWCSAARWTQEAAKAAEGGATQ